MMLGLNDTWKNFIIKFCHCALTMSIPIKSFGGVKGAPKWSSGDPGAFLMLSDQEPSGSVLECGASQPLCQGPAGSPWQCSGTYYAQNDMRCQGSNLGSQTTTLSLSSCINNIFTIHHQPLHSYVYQRHQCIFISRPKDINSYPWL